MDILGKNIGFFSVHPVGFCSVIILHLCRCVLVVWSFGITQIEIIHKGLTSGPVIRINNRIIFVFN